MTKYGEEKCIECKYNRGCYMQSLNSHEYGTEFVCRKENEELEKAVKRLEKYSDNTILKLLHEEDIKEIEKLNKIINKAIDYINENGITNITCMVGQKSTKTELFKDNASLYELLEILKGNDIEFDVLKALNTDLDDDVEMG